MVKKERLRALFFCRLLDGETIGAYNRHRATPLYIYIRRYCLKNNRTLELVG